MQRHVQVRLTPRNHMRTNQVEVIYDRRWLYLEIATAELAIVMDGHTLLYSVTESLARHEVLAPTD